jgi:hypothetical protein
MAHDQPPEHLPAHHSRAPHSSASHVIASALVSTVFLRDTVTHLPLPSVCSGRAMSRAAVLQQTPARNPMHRTRDDFSSRIAAIGFSQSHCSVLAGGARARTARNLPREQPRARRIQPAIQLSAAIAIELLANDDISVIKPVISKDA